MSNKMDATGMKTETERKILPKLRFPEFKDASEWEEKSLGKIMPITSCKRVHESDWAKDGVPFYRAREIVALNKDKPISPLFISEELYKSNIKLSGEIKAGDLLVTGVGSIGIPYLVKDGDKFYFKDGNIIWLKNNGQEITGDFLFLLYGSEYIQKQISTMADPGTVGTYTIDNAKNTLVMFPTNQVEQKKIADCLSSLDDILTAQTQKLDTLKTHKKGLLQQLFPAEGETVPRLRFPEFQNAGEWKEKILESFCKIGDIDHKMPASVTDGIPYIMTGDFFGINNIDFDNAKKISADDYEQLSKKIKPEFGDIIIARYASVGAVRYIETKIKFLVSYSCAIIKCNKSENSKYLYYIFQSDAIQSKIGLEINMSSQKNIGTDSIKKLNIFLPTLPEQQKIADCLSSLDDLITAQTQKLEALKTHKKALMQQLFPVAGFVGAKAPTQYMEAPGGAESA